MPTCLSLYGLFSVRLGSIIVLSIGLLGADPEVTPREKLSAVPYAIRSTQSGFSASSAWVLTEVGSSQATTTLTSFTTVPDTDISFELTESRQVVALFTGGVTNLSAVGGPVRFRLVVDDTPKAQVGPHIYQSGVSVPIVIHWGETLLPGTHNIRIEWMVDEGTGRFLQFPSPPGSGVFLLL